MIGVSDVPGLEFNFALLLHGEQDIEIHRPIPSDATVTNEGRVVELYDKGKACLCVLENVSKHSSGDALFSNRFSLPDFAKMGDFHRPILHGLCSYGLVCQAIVDECLDGDTTRVKRWQARFAGVAYPGETYQIAYWREGDSTLVSSGRKR